MTFLVRHELIRIANLNASWTAVRSLRTRIFVDIARRVMV